MNISEVVPYEDVATDTIVAIINTARFQLGERMNLFQLAKSRAECHAKAKVSLHNLEAPLVKSCEKLIHITIQTKWKLTDTFHYTLRYVGSSVDECAHYFYYEVVFSQPTIMYPIPQATVTVFFRVHKHLERPGFKGVPVMTFRIEGSHNDHDVTQVFLNVDWILAVLQAKLKYFRRIESIRLF